MQQSPSGPATFCAAPADHILETYFVLRMVIAGGALQTLGALADPALRRRYRMTYRVLAVLVVVFPALAVLRTLVAEPSAALFAGEAAALWSSAAFWVLKTYELSRSHAEVRVV